MKLTIRDFGPIKEITFDLSKGFHLIYGANSIGKSYSTYCLYCVMKNVTRRILPYGRYYYRDEKEFESQKSTLKPILKNVKSGKTTELLMDFAASFVEDRLQRLLMPGITSSLSSTFSNLNLLKNAKSDTPYSIRLKWDGDDYIDILSDEFGLPYLDKVRIANNWQFLEKKTKSSRYSLLIDGKMAIGAPTEEAFIQDFIVKMGEYVNTILFQISCNITDVYYLPASRSGLYQALSSFTPILAELTQNRFFLNSKKIELPSLSEPLSDYFLDISTINRKEVNSKYDDIIKNIEDNILEGSVRFDEETQKIKFKPKNLNFELDISEVSSMVAELSPIVIFLRHILHHKFSQNRGNFYEGRYLQQRFGYEDNSYQIIFIEEPEAHLHPEVQVKLMEIFAELIKHKIKIVMTSHSNYMFNKINNIILKDDLKTDEIAVYQLIKTPSGSVVNSEMDVSEHGINDANFTDVSKRLYEERVNILED
ncbi:MAG: hypothetical protein K0S09_429 [Sphingobacteriaceae bacterium]|jgi:energy-coupling factor transporter ATP-binding protein EcfA2|nr:hypothetical protein [Sphingobacteriaceae bacterium]